MRRTWSASFLGLAALFLGANRAVAIAIHVPADQPTIQAAIDVASPGDTILVSEGVYPEVVRMVGSGISIRSTSGRDRTVIDGTGLGESVITVENSDEPFLVEGFTLRGGEGNTTETCLIPGSSRVGGGLYAFGCTITVQACRFEANGAGIDSGGAAFGENATLIFRDTEFLANGGPASGRTNTHGGAVAICGFPTSLDVERCLFAANGPAVYGGGIYVSSSTDLPVRVADTEFRENEASLGGGLGAFLLVSGQVAVDRCRFEGNVASQGGGATVVSATSADLLITSTTFVENEAALGGGLNLVVGSGGRMRVAGCLFRDHDTSNGGGVRADINTAGTVEVANGTLARNPGAFGGGLQASTAFGGTITVDNTIFHESDLDLSGAVQVRYSHLPEGVPASHQGPGNRTGDPRFVDSTANDFRLLPDSPLVDAGLDLAVPAELTVDLSGNPRFADGDGDTVPTVDPGAYELFLDLEACAAGNVNSGAGSVADVLFINNSSGGPSRTVEILTGRLITVDLLAPPRGPRQGIYVLWAWTGGAFHPRSLVARGTPLGCLVNPTPLDPHRAPQPAFCVPGRGVPRGGCTDRPVRAAPPFTPWSVSAVVDEPMRLTLQGLIQDQGSAHPRGFSVTNAVTLHVIDR